MEDSFVSTLSQVSSAPANAHIHGRCFPQDGVNGIPLHAGAGLQQLSESPPEGVFKKVPTSPSYSPPAGHRPRPRSGTGTSGGASSSVRSHRHSDSQHDAFKLSLTLSGVTLALLESEPAYTCSITPQPSVERRDSDSSSGSDGGRGMEVMSGLEEGGLDPMKYLEGVASLLSGEVSRRAIQGCQEQLSRGLPNDHLFLWMSTLRTTFLIEGPQVDFDLSVASAEFWEYLYRNEANPHITKPISVCPLLQLCEDTAQSKPCLKLRLTTSSPEPAKKRSRNAASSDLTLLELDLTTLHVHADVTLWERLQPILHPPSPSPLPSMRGAPNSTQLKQSLYMTTSNFQTVNMHRQAVFNQALTAESSGGRDQKLSLKLNVAAIKLSLRFPVPDLSEGPRPPWYHPSLRPELLSAEVEGLACPCLLHSHLRPSEITCQFHSAKVYLSSDGSPESRQLFLTISSAARQAEREWDSGTPKISITVLPVSDSILEEGSKSSDGGPLGGEPGSLDSFDWTDLSSHEPSPFSGRRAMFSTQRADSGRPASDGGSDPHSEQLILPGSPQEMAEFEQHSLSTAQFAVCCSLPLVCVHLPSNTFLNTLYNRLAVDLVLWQPARPSAGEKANAAKSMMVSSCMDVIQPAVTHEERFQMCKSILKEEDSDEEDYRGEMAATLLPSPALLPPSSHQPPSSKGLSLLAFALVINQGRVTMITSVEEPATSVASTTGDGEPKGESLESVYQDAISEERLLDLSPQMTTPPSCHHDNGLVLIDLTQLSMFVVSGYLGDSSHDYFSAQLREFSLHHIGSFATAGLPAYSCVEPLEGGGDILALLQPVVFHSESTTRLRTSGGGQGERDEQPMVAIAMEMKLDTARGSKTNKCAVAVRAATLRYHASAHQHSCFTQLAGFLALVEEEVAGYEPPLLITELHFHLQEAAAEYRPLYLPLHAVLTLDSVSLSTSVVAGSPLLVVRLMLDEALLLLSNRPDESTDLKQDYVCVLELDWFELTLRLCSSNSSRDGEDYQKLFSRLPEVSVECCSNTVHLRTCADSCVALRDLLVYLASNGDLQPPPADAPRLRDYASLVSEPSPLSSLGSHSESPPVVAGVSSGGNIGDLLFEAMEDTPPSATTPRQSGTSLTRAASGSTSLGRRRQPTSRGRTHHSSAVAKPNVKIQILGDKSVEMLFDSDSDDDERRAHVASSRTGRGGALGVVSSPRSPLSPTSVASGDDMFSESEGDFCIVDIPTATKMAPNAKPVVRSLLEKGEEIKIVDNYFSIPDRHTDQLQRPKHFPEPISQFTLKGINIVWHLYGGSDFSPPFPTTPSSSPSSTPSPTPGASPLNMRRSSSDRAVSSPLVHRQRSFSGRGGGPSPSSSPGTTRRQLLLRPTVSAKSAASSAAINMPTGGGKKRRGTGSGRGYPSVDWKARGGPGRDHDVLMEMELDKVRLQHETYPTGAEQSSRLVLLVADLELRDRLAQSQINKFLYQYTNDAMPRQSHANMVSLKVLFTRPELEACPDIEEAAVRLSMLPLRLNIDQDAVLFLYDFFKRITDATVNPIPVPAVATRPARSSSDPSSWEGEGEEGGGEGGGGGGTVDAEEPVADQRPGEVFVKSFVFHPNLPIRIDYMGKRFQNEAMGTLAGILMGLSHLDCSEVTLKSLSYKKGLLGWDKVVEYASSEWAEDIRGSQLPLILKGVGPMHHVTQLVQGVVNLVWLPIQQYQEDGRIVWGLQRGASSFTTSTGVAFVELSGRLLHTVQSMAQMVYDVVTPVEHHSTALAQARPLKAPHQPLDFREGVANAYDVITVGIGDTAMDLYTAATYEHEERGVTGAVGGVLRQLPGTIVKPIIVASEATRHVLGGVKNQFVPDARREAEEKWRTDEGSDL